MMTKGLATEWAKHGVQVNAIGPGYFETPLNKALMDNPDFNDWLCKRTPAGRWGKLEELVGAAMFLSSPALRLRQRPPADGGRRHSPPPSDPANRPSVRGKRRSRSAAETPAQ